MKSFTGIAGFTSVRELDALSRILDELDPRGEFFKAGSVGVGVLTSAKTLDGKGNRYPLRYPKREDVALLMTAALRDPRLYKILHVSAEGDPAEVAEVVRAGVEWGGYLDAMQINAAWPGVTVMRAAREARHRRAFLDLDIVLQVGPACLAPFLTGIAAHLDGGGSLSQCRELSVLASTLAPYIAEAQRSILDLDHAFAVLFDFSAGTGKGLDPRVVEAILSYAEVVFDDSGHTLFGAAGGLDGDTVPALGQLLQRCPSTFLDAEGRLRDDAPGGGRLDMVKVRAYLAAVMRVRRGR